MAPTDLVSCLMVTRPTADRLPFVKRSIGAYTRQSHPSKELLIVLDPAQAETSTAITQHISSLERSDIRLIDVAERDQTLGALRNRSVREAQGDVLCQWDDDDLHHPERIERQLTAMRGAERGACYLQEVMQYLERDRTIYWTNWLMTQGQAHPGTMMCERTMGPGYPETGPTARLGEDTLVLADFLDEDQVFALTGEPHLFVYVTHGANSWPLSHHQMLTDRLSISIGLLKRREAAIRAGLSAFAFGPGRLVVMGSNGPAFELSDGLAPL